MMAGPVSDTVEHADEGERVTVSKGASKAAQVDARATSVAGKLAAAAKPAKSSTAKATPKKTAGKAPTAKTGGASKGKQAAAKPAAGKRGGHK